MDSGGIALGVIEFVEQAIKENGNKNHALNIEKNYFNW